MRQRTVTNTIVWLIGIVGIVLFALMNSLWAASYTEKILIQTPNWDSVRYSIEYRSGGAWVVQDTGWLVPPDSADVVNQTDRQYNYRYVWWLNGDSTTGSMERIGFIQGNEAVGSGTGSNDWTIFVMDTTGGSDTTGVALATMTIRSMSGALEAEQRSQTSGDFTFTVALDSLTVRVSKPGTLINDGDIDTFVVAAHGQIDTTWVTFDGVPNPSTPGSPNLCNVWGFIYDNQQAVVPYAKVRFRLSGTEIKDTCTNTILSSDPVFAETDSLGYFLIALVQTHCVNDALWNAQVIKDDDEGETTGQEHSFAIPSDSTTYHLVF